MNNYLELLPNWFFILYVVLFGLCVGSFLNVVILRGLTGEGLVFERSRCPKCKTQLKWYMNIPLLSYMLLRGECAFCKTKISLQYPIVEFVTAIMFLVAYLVFGLSLKTLFLFIFFALFIVLSVTDFKETVIVDIHAYILFAFALLYSYLSFGIKDLFVSFLGAIFGFVVFEIMARLGKLFCGCRMFGEGDSLIALGLGAIFGWENLIVVIGLSVLIQSISAIPILIIKAFNNQNKKLGISYIFVFLAMVTLFILNQINFIKNELYYLFFVIVVTLLLLWSLKNILIEIKNKFFWISIIFPLEFSIFISLIF